MVVIAEWMAISSPTVAFEVAEEPNLCALRDTDHAQRVFSLPGLLVTEMDTDITRSSLERNLAHFLSGNTQLPKALRY